MFSGKQLGAECIQACLEKELRPKFVVTNPEDKGVDTPSDLSVLKLCKEKGIPTVSFNEFSKSPEKYLEENGAQVAFSTFCSRIIPKHLISLFPEGISNLHFSLLPKYRGQFPTVYAIFNGDQETGVTLHWINEGTDSGDIILQRKIKIPPDLTGHGLFEKCKKVGVELFIEQLEFFQSNSWPKATPQVGVESNPIQPKILPNNGKIDWNWSGSQIYNFLRACYHPNFPLPGFSIGEIELEIKKK